jgi:hypothetical protein
MSGSNGLLSFAADIDPALEDDFNRWYEDEHLAERLAIPGFLTATRYRCLGGGPKYLALYEVTNSAVFTSEEYLRFLKGAGETPWTRRILASCSNAERRIYEKISERNAG